MSVARGSWEISAVNQGKNQGRPLAWIYRRLPPNLVRETGDAKLQTSFYSLFRSQKHSSVFTHRAFCSHVVWGIIKCSTFFCILISPSFFLCFLAWVGNTASRSMQKHAATKPSSFSPIPRIFKNKAIFFTADASLLILTHSPQSPDFENISKFYCRDATKLGPRCF